MSEGPDRLFIALLEDWNEMHPEGSCIPTDLQCLIERYLNWSRVIGAEKVIHKLQRNLELMPHHNERLPYSLVMELVRTMDPDQLEEITPRNWVMPGVGRPKKLVTETINTTQDENKE
jgi:hypothetical protein